MKIEILKFVLLWFQLLLFINVRCDQHNAKNLSPDELRNKRQTLSTHNNRIEDPNNEPANYDFQYEIYGGGNLFGHQESRRDQKSSGRYHVMLPDGRRQVVSYVADETGYHPTITYELVNSL